MPSRSPPPDEFISRGGKVPWLFLWIIVIAFVISIGVLAVQANSMNDRPPPRYLQHGDFVVDAETGCWYIVYNHNGYWGMVLPRFGSDGKPMCDGPLPLFVENKE